MNTEARRLQNVFGRQQQPDRGRLYYNPAHSLNSWLDWTSLSCLLSPSCSWVETRRCRQPAPSALRPPWFSHLVEPAPPSWRPTSPVRMLHVARALPRATQGLCTSVKVFLCLRQIISPAAALSYYWFHNFIFLLLVALWDSSFFSPSLLPFHHLLYLSLFRFCLFLNPFIWKLPEEKITARRVSPLRSHANVSLASCNFYYSFLRVSVRPPGRHWERGAAVVRLQLFTAADSGRPLLLTVSLGLRWERSDSSKHLQATCDLFLGPGDVLTDLRSVVIHGSTSEFNWKVFLDLYIAAGLLPISQYNVTWSCTWNDCCAIFVGAVREDYYKYYVAFQLEMTYYVWTCLACF